MVQTLKERAGHRRPICSPYIT